MIIRNDSGEKELIKSFNITEEEYEALEKVAAGDMWDRNEITTRLEIRGFIEFLEDSQFDGFQIPEVTSDGWIARNLHSIKKQRS